MFFAVHLDTDEVFVEEGGGGGVLKRFVLHDVAPVARGVADADEDRDVTPLRFLKRFFAPSVPSDGVAGVASEVRAGGVLQRAHACTVATVGGGSGGAENMMQGLFACGVGRLTA